MRPVGGMLIGSYADRHGRRAAMTLTLWLMGLGCGLIALAPTYAQMGIAGPVIMVLARLIQGFAAGGEVGASTTLLVEHAPPSRRGFYSSWQFGSQSLGVMLGALVVALLTAALTPEQMKDWGWRVPFVIGILTVPVGAYIRRNLEETLEPQPAPGAAHARSDHQPLRRVLAGHKGAVARASCWSSAAWSAPRSLASICRPTPTRNWACRPRPRCRPAWCWAPSVSWPPSSACWPTAWDASA